MMEEEIKVLEKVKLNWEKKKKIQKIYISLNFEKFSLRRINELQEIIVVRQDLILLKIKSKEESVQVEYI